MAAIWNDIEITWGGEEYIVTPTMKFLNYLEQDEGSSLSKLLVRGHNNDLPSSTACTLISRTLTYAGCAVTPEHVFLETNAGITAVNLSMAILMGCMPVPIPSKKKPVAPTPKKQRKPRAKRTS
jgi:hypothetical protein